MWQGGSAPVAEQADVDVRGILQSHRSLIVFDIGMFLAIIALKSAAASDGEKNPPVLPEDFLFYCLMASTCTTRRTFLVKPQSIP